MTFRPPATIVAIYCYLNSKKGPALPCVLHIALSLQYGQKIPDADKIQEIVFNKFGHDITDVRVEVVEDQRYQNTEEE